MHNVQVLMEALSWNNVCADQNAELYSAPGQFNPKAAKASKKKAKKQKKQASGDAYDFAEAFGAKATM